MLAAAPQSSDAHSLAAFHLLNVGRVAEALAHARAAKALDPRDWAVSIGYGISVWFAGDQDEALAAFERHLAEWPEDNMNAALLMVACARAGLWERFEQLIEPRRLKRYPLREHSGIVAVCCAMRDPTPANLDLLRAGLAVQIQRTGGADPIILFWSSALGLSEDVRALLETVRFGPGKGQKDHAGVIAYRPVSMFKAKFPELREDPAFCTYCARLGLAQFWLDTGLWPDCADQVGYDFRAACAQAAATTPCDLTQWPPA
jgi:tetratricopeptide (TPR) repeat protein